MRQRRRVHPALLALAALLLAAGSWSALLYLDARHQAADARALELRKQAQAQAMADFYSASLDCNGDALLATVSSANAERVKAYFADAAPLGLTFERKWDGDVLLLRSKGAWGDTLCYEFTANGDKREAVVAIKTYVPVAEGDQAKISQSEGVLRLEDGRWIVTALGDNSIEEMF